MLERYYARTIRDSEGVHLKIQFQKFLEFLNLNLITLQAFSKVITDEVSLLSQSILLT